MTTHRKYRLEVKEFETTSTITAEHKANGDLHICYGGYPVVLFTSERSHGAATVHLLGGKEGGSIFDRSLEALVEGRRQVAKMALGSALE